MGGAPEEENATENRLPAATEEEEKAFEEYQKEIEKQQPQILSYENLLERKETEEKKAEIKRLRNRLGERCTNLHSQQYKDPTSTDRLGKRFEYYQDIVNQVDRNTLFEGDIDKQLKLLRLLASRESDTSAAEKIIRQLAIFETELRQENRKIERESK